MTITIGVGSIANRIKQNYKIRLFIVLFYRHFSFTVINTVIITIIKYSRVYTNNIFYSVLYSYILKMYVIDKVLGYFKRKI